MSPMKTLASASLGVMVALSATPAAAEPGSKFRVTMQMEMPGMPMQMPAQTHEVCGPKPSTTNMQPNPDMVPRDSHCQIKNFKVNGNRSSFDMVCTGPGAMSGHGEWEVLGPDRYRGRIDVDVQGQKMVMKHEGQRIGDCEYTPPAVPAAKP